MAAARKLPPQSSHRPKDSKTTGGALNRRRSFFAWPAQSPILSPLAPPDFPHRTGLLSPA